MMSDMANGESVSAAPLLGSRLYSARMAERYSQIAVARLLDVHHTTIAAWERGPSEPRASQLVTLAKLYKTTVEHLLGLDARAAE